MKTKLVTLTLISVAAYYAFNNNAPSQSAASPVLKPAFIVVNDDSGTLTDPERGRTMKLLLLAQLKALHTKRRYANAQLQIISSSFGRTVWVGKVSDLRTARANEVITKIESNAQNCNKLAESFEAVHTAIRQLEQQKANDIKIYFLSSMISTPAPCKDVKQIALPQLPVPVNFETKLAFSDAVSSISFYYVNPHQLRVYQSVLAPVAAWANASGKSFGLFDMEDTEFQLRSGLLGVK